MTLIEALLLVIAGSQVVAIIGIVFSKAKSRWVWRSRSPRSIESRVADQEQLLSALLQELGYIIEDGKPWRCELIKLTPAQREKRKS